VRADLPTHDSGCGFEAMQDDVFAGKTKQERLWTEGGQNHAACREETQRLGGQKLEGLFLILAPQGLVQSIAHQIGHGKEFPVAIQFNHLARGIKNHLAVSTFAEMFLQDALEILGEFAVEIL